jgi:hypothetical protein
MDRNDPTHVETEQEREERERANRDKRNASDARPTPNQNPPRTTRNGFTAPKFGSAGSGGAELEPGPERD